MSPTPSPDVLEQPIDDLRLSNLENMLVHLRQYPVDDVSCSLEVSIPMSMLLKIMQKNAQTNMSMSALVKDALEQAGYTSLAS